MTLAVWFKKENFLAAKNETFIAIKRVYDEAGIEIPYNKLDVKVYDSENQFIAGAARKIKAKAQPKTKKIDKRIRGKSKATKNLIESESAKEYDPDDEH